MFDQITPIILTYNEAPNIGRTLEKLRWAKDIVVVDSFSTDETLSIVKRFPQARIFQRRFDDFGGQRNFGMTEGGIKTEWILMMDADYVLTDEFVEEVKRLNPIPEIVGYKTRFIYCIYGHPLRGTVYPPLVSLFRKDCGRYVADGHTQNLIIEGEIEDLKAPILHDDHKSLARWLISQDHYARLEAVKLIQTDAEQLNIVDRFRRRIFLAPFAMFLYCLFGSGLILDGLFGWFYTFQRVFAEVAISLYLLQYDLKKLIPKIES